MPRPACGGRGKCKWGKPRRMGKQRTSLGKEFGSRRGEGGWGCVRGARWEAWKVLLQTAGGSGRAAAAQRGGGTRAGPREASGLVGTLAQPGRGGRGRLKDPAPGRVRVLGADLILGSKTRVPPARPTPRTRALFTQRSLRLLPGRGD